MRDNIFKRCANLFRLVWRHIRDPKAEMSAAKLRENFGYRNAVSEFVTPMALTLAVTSLIGSLICGGEMNIGAIVYGMLTTAIVPYMFYYVVKVASCELLRRFGIKEETEEKAKTMTLQLMLLYFLVTFFYTIAPEAKLLACLYIYAFVMLWMLADGYLGIKDERRVTFTLIEIAICAITLTAITLVINIITPKHP
ncbi:MAG: hypothetical protein MJ002_04740 [Paludibacteraceae bacterium]|nr:hypothetical protein [Paludibacteraceae bacterium]